MPVINRSPAQSFPPEGPLKGHILAVTEGSSPSKRTPYFELAIRDLKTGRAFKTKLYLTDTAYWKIDAICRSSGLILPPDGAPYQLTEADLTGRVCYLNLKHTPTEYGTKAEVCNFWSPAYAFQQAPELEHIPDPPGVPEHKQLMEAAPSAPMPPPAPAPEVIPPTAPAPGKPAHELAEALAQVKRMQEECHDRNQ